MALSALSQFNPYAVDVPPYVSAAGIVVPGFNDVNVTTAVQTLVNKFPILGANPGLEQLAEQTCRDFASIVRRLSQLGA